MLTFIKENTTNAKPPYGTYITKHRYSVYNAADDLVGQYFIGDAVDYFCYDENEFGAATAVYSIDKWQHSIINQKDNTTVGQFIIQPQNSILIENTTYNFVQLTNTKKETTFLLSNETQQLVIHNVKQRHKLESKIVIECSGSMESEVCYLLCFVSLYLLERILASS